MRVKPQHYRDLAKRSRELAKRAADKDIEAHLLDVARQYDLLAEEAGAKA